MKKKRCCVYIDGSNFYYKLKELGFNKQLEFDYKRFVEYLVGKDLLNQSTT